MSINNNILRLIDSALSSKDYDLKTPYLYNGNNVPRVTSIISDMIHEEYIANWANYLGFKRKRYKDELNFAADKGSYVHSMIENKMINDQDPDFSRIPRDMARQVATCYNSFLLWYDEANIKDAIILGQEMELSCPYFGGTLDLLIQVDGKVYIIDFKSSNHLSFRYFLQMAAYRYILENYRNIKIDGVCAVRLFKDEIMYEELALDFQIPEQLEFANHYEEAFLSLVYSYYMRIRAEEEFKLMTNNKLT